MQLPGLHAAQCNSQEDFQFFERPKLNQYCRMRRDSAWRYPLANFHGTDGERRITATVGQEHLEWEVRGRSLEVTLNFFLEALRLAIIRLDS
jgi:hypothetical protein